MYSTQLGEEKVLKGLKCQDCGNQAKKDCAYSRWRSCCNNKGFNYHTHIRSTWIPADRKLVEKISKMYPLQRVLKCHISDEDIDVTLNVVYKKNYFRMFCN